jgi:acyl-CoA synthetase (AMP-forming)/AMP-acid ligase II
MTNSDWFYKRIRDFKDTIAFSYDDLAISYTELGKSIDSSQKWLTSSGVEKFSKVAIVGDFNFESISLILALSMNKNVVIPFSKNSTLEIGKALEVSGCDWLLDLSSEANSLSRKSIPSKTDLFELLKTDNAGGLVVFSSGTSGEPKGMLHSFDRLVSRFAGQGKANVAVPILMFDHYGGYNTVFGLLASGSKIVILKERTVDTVCRTIEREGVTLLPTTPSFLSLLLASKTYLKYNLDSLKKITYGTEVMPDSLLMRLVNAFPNTTFQQTYGLSEVGVLGSKSKSNDSTWVRIGGNGFETKVVDQILWIKSSFSMLGYIGEDLPQSEIDGWFNTEDRVEVDGEYFRILGRDSELINVGGQKVFPIEIEDALLSFDGVLAVRVFAESHGLLGQVPSAEVVLDAEQIGKITKSELRSHCRKVLASYKVPQKIEFVEEILLTTRMKKARK